MDKLTLRRKGKKAMGKMTGRGLKQMRNKYGFSQAYVLEDYQDKRLDRSMLSKIENGIVDPPESLCIHVCKLCWLSVYETAKTVYGHVATAKETRPEAYKGMVTAKRRKKSCL